MAGVKIGDVSVNPAIAVSVGCAEETHGIPSATRTGKNRPTTIYRPRKVPGTKSPNEAGGADREGLLRIAAAMERRNDLLERSLKEKKVM